MYVYTPNRKENILDMCYGNITNAFRSRSYPPFELAEHSIVSLLLLYEQELKRHKPRCYNTPQWSEDVIIQLQGSLACTDWDIFDGDLNEMVSVITDYIDFCINGTIPVQTIISQTLDHSPDKTEPGEKSTKILGSKTRLASKRRIKNEVWNLATWTPLQKVKYLAGCELITNLFRNYHARFDTQGFSAECEGWFRAVPPPDPEEPSSSRSLQS